MALENTLDKRSTEQGTDLNFRQHSTSQKKPKQKEESKPAEISRHAATTPEFRSFHGLSVELKLAPIQQEKNIFHVKWAKTMESAGNCNKLCSRI